jgi:hypothetical protein
VRLNPWCFTEWGNKSCDSWIWYKKTSLHYTSKHKGLNPCNTRRQDTQPQNMYKDNRSRFWFRKLHFCQLSAWTGLGWMRHWTDRDKRDGMGLNPFEGACPLSLQTVKQTNKTRSIFTCSMDRKGLVGNETIRCKLWMHLVNKWAIPSNQLLTKLGHSSDNS